MPDAKTVELVRKIIEFCLCNGEFESLFLSPQPSFTVDATALFDFLSETTGIDKATIGRMVDEIQDARIKEAKGAIS